MKRMAIVCCASVLLLSFGLASCTRAKPETPTPTIVASAITPKPTTLAPTHTPVFTPQPPPTSVPLTAEPTVISVAQPSPTIVAVATAPSVAPTSPPAAGEFEYTVQWGDTLYSIALRFNTTVDAIVALNNLPDARYISVGQVLKIVGTAAPTPGPGTEYVVQAGDTLYSIARRHNTTVQAIQAANGIVNPWFIRVGQRLVIPGGSTSAVPGGNTYVVQPGDTLYSIAAHFGKNVWDIIVANNLSEPYWILVGQVLTIPP